MPKKSPEFLERKTIEGGGVGDGRSANSMMRQEE
jgi:hypothetical protein